MKQGVARAARVQFPAHCADINDPLNVRVFYVTLFLPGKIEETIKVLNPTLLHTFFKCYIGSLHMK